MYSDTNVPTCRNCQNHTINGKQAVKTKRDLTNTVYILLSHTKVDEIYIAIERNIAITTYR